METGCLVIKRIDAIQGNHVQVNIQVQCRAEPLNKCDDAGRIRIDDWELAEDIQAEVRRRWPLVTTENLAELADLDGFREDFLKIFGFGFDHVDYDAEQDPTLGRNL